MSGGVKVLSSPNPWKLVVGDGELGGVGAVGAGGGTGAGIATALVGKVALLVSPTSGTLPVAAKVAGTKFDTN